VTNLRPVASSHWLSGPRRYADIADVQTVGPSEEVRSCASRKSLRLIEAIPPKLYGGTERVVHWLTEELVALGHDVTLFASGDSVTSARLEAMWPMAVRFDESVRDAFAFAFGDARERAPPSSRVRLPPLPPRLSVVLPVLPPTDAMG